MAKSTKTDFAGAPFSAMIRALPVYGCYRDGRKLAHSRGHVFWDWLDPRQGRGLFLDQSPHMRFEYATSEGLGLDPTARMAATMRWLGQCYEVMRERDLCDVNPTLECLNAEAFARENYGFFAMEMPLWEQ